MKKIYKFRVPQTVFIKQTGIKGVTRDRFLSDDQTPIYDLEVGSDGVVEFFEKELTARSPKLKKIKNVAIHEKLTLGKGTFVGKTEDGYDRYEVDQHSLELSNPLPRAASVKTEKPFKRVTISTATKREVIAAYHSAKRATKPF